MPGIATLNRPTFLDSFTPHAPTAHTTQARGGYGGIGNLNGITALTGTGMSSFNGQTTYERTIEQVQHFTYWDYVGIRLICDRASEPFPMLSYTVTNAGQSNLEGTDATSQRSRRGQSRLTHQHRQWVQQKYGLCQSAQDDLETLPDQHAFANLLRNPNPDDTWNEFAYEHFLFLNLTGKVFWWVIPNGFGLPTQLIVIPTQWVRPDYDSRTGLLYQYTVTVTGTSAAAFTIPAEQIITTRLKSPRNKLDGYSPLSAAPKWIDNVESIEGSRYHSFRNGANPDLLVKLGEKWADPTEDVLTRIKEKFMRRASGISRSGEPMIVPPDIELEKWSNTPREMDYTASGDQSRDNNLALHNVPKVLAGITTDVNRATVEAAEVIFCGNKINPQLRHFAGTLTWLGWRFDPRIRVWFQDVTPKNAQQELLEAQADFSMGAITPDERRQMRGRETIGTPMYETGYLPAGFSPLADELQPDPNIDPATGQPYDDGTGGDPNIAGNDAAKGGNAADSSTKGKSDAGAKKKSTPKKPGGKSTKQSAIDFDQWADDDESPLSI